MYSRRPQGFASSGEQIVAHVATVEVVERVDPLDEERVPLAADLHVGFRREGEHHPDLTPADAAEIRRLPPGPSLLEAEDVAIVADRRDHVRDREDRLGAPDQEPPVIHGALFLIRSRGDG